jgi:hypothetical protein
VRIERTAQMKQIMGMAVAIGMTSVAFTALALTSVFA